MDCTFKTEQGNFNYRVGVIITDGRKVLMARNPNEERAFYYSVGGRVRFGESMEEAALRELKEETGLDCEIDRSRRSTKIFSPMTTACSFTRSPAFSRSSQTKSSCKSRTVTEPKEVRRRVSRMDRFGQRRRRDDLPGFLPHRRF